MPILTKWFTVRSRSKGILQLAGTVKDHPQADKVTGRLVDGHRVITSDVVGKVSDRAYRTWSDNIYRLEGEPGTDEDWASNPRFEVACSRLTLEDFEVELAYLQAFAEEKDHDA